MTERQLTSKKTSLKRTCYYSLTHFCDGTPNLSECTKAKKRPPCPMRLECKHKLNQIIKRLGEA